MARSRGVDIADVSPMAWRLLRTAAGYEQREVERALDDVIQAHISMLENDRRGLSQSRREALFDLYTAELTDDQVRALVESF
jgi:transcriptional regulator with XRE-family HTH domain